MDELSYTVVSPLDHDGARYEEGDTVSLPETVGAPLVLCGALLPPAENPPASIPTARKRSR